MPLESGSLLAGGHIAELDGLVVARYGQRLALPAERHGPDRGVCSFARALVLFGMPFEGGSLLVGRQVPELDVAVQRGQGLAIGAEGHGVDMESLSLEGGPYLAGGHVPQLDIL